MTHGKFSCSIRRFSVATYSVKNWASARWLRLSRDKWSRCVLFERSLSGFFSFIFSLSINIWNGPNVCVRGGEKTISGRWMCILFDLVQQIFTLSHFICLWKCKSTELIRYHYTGSWFNGPCQWLCIMKHWNQPAYMSITINDLNPSQSATQAAPCAHLISHMLFSSD